MAVIELNKENFDKTITNNSLIIVDFWAPWCGPCKSFAPTYEMVSEKFPEIIFAKVNTEDEQELGANFQIRSIPTLMIFKEQITIFSQAGALTQVDLENLVKKAQGVDMEVVRAEMAKETEKSKS